MFTAGTVREKVRINQSNVLCQPASNCILTQCNVDWKQRIGYMLTTSMLQWSFAGEVSIWCYLVSQGVKVDVTKPELFIWLLPALSLPRKLSLIHCAGVNVSEEESCWWWSGMPNMSMFVWTFMYTWHPRLILICSCLQSAGAVNLIYKFIYIYIYI